MLEGKPCAEADERRLKEFAKAKVGAKLIEKELGKTEEAVPQKMRRVG